MKADTRIRKLIRYINLVLSSTSDFYLDYLKAENSYRYLNCLTTEDLSAINPDGELDLDNKGIPYQEYPLEFFPVLVKYNELISTVSNSYVKIRGIDVCITEETTCFLTFKNDLLDYFNQENLYYAWKDYPEVFVLDTSGCVRLHNCPIDFFSGLMQPMTLLEFFNYYNFLNYHSDDLCITIDKAITRFLELEKAHQRVPKNLQ